MKIIQIIHKEQNRGAETFTCQLSDHLLLLGHEVKIVAIYKGTGTLPFAGEITCLDASPRSRFLDVKAWKKLADIIKTFKPDIVQANAGDTLKYAVFSKKLFGWQVPVIFRNASEVGRYLTSFFQKQYNNYLYKKVDWIASVSQASENDLIEHFPFLRKKIEKLSIGLEEKNQIHSVELEPISVQHIMHVGGFSFEKNHLGLLKIFRRVLEKRQDVHLHLIGDGPLRREVEEEVKMMEISQYVTFYGFVTNPLSYISAADVLVLPSVIEGLPGVILEAMYCKIPVVAYDVGGISEILSPETGYLIKKNDEAAFARVLLEGFTGFDQRRILCAHEMVRRNYMNREIALKFVNSYRKLVDGGE